jgi:hypothetical protein
MAIPGASRTKASSIIATKAESSFVPLGWELIEQQVFPTRADARSAILELIEPIYKCQRSSNPRLLTPLAGATRYLINLSVKLGTE